MSLYTNPSTWSLATPGGIPYKIYEGSPSGSFEEDNADWSEKVIIVATDLEGFIRESFSEYTIIPGGTWLYDHPARSYGMTGDNPDGVPGFESLVTKKISVESFPPGKPSDPFEIIKDESGQTNSKIDLDVDIDGIVNSTNGTYAQFLLLTIQFSPGKCTTDNEDALEISCHASGEFLLYSGGGKTYWDNGEDEDPTPLKVPNVPISRVQPGNEWSLKFKRVPFEDLPDAMGALRGSLGCINSVEMASLKNADIGTILLAGFSVTSSYSWRSKKPFSEIEVKLLEKRIEEDDKVKGHNYFLNPNTGKFQLVLGPNNLNFIYSSSDLNQLLFGNSGQNAGES